MEFGFEPDSVMEPASNQLRTSSEPGSVMEFALMALYEGHISLPASGL